MAPTRTWNTADLVAKDKAHHTHSLSNLKQIQETGPLVMVHGEGVHLWDSDGKQYIDGFAGLWNINVGHGRHELGQVMAAQVDELAFVPTFFGLASPPVIELSAKLATMFPDPINHFQFTSGGAESNETAIKMARYFWYLKGKPEKVKIISRLNGYHGIAMGALAATGLPAYHTGFGPLVPGFVHVLPPYDYRYAEGRSEDEFVSMLVQNLEEMIAREGADTIAAFIGEPVQGAGGVIVPPDTYWGPITEVLKRHDILFIADEVISGFGRTGRMFGMETYGFVPDIVSFAKGITSGYIPLGGVGITDEIADALNNKEGLFMHGFTYSGHPVACAVGLANIDIIERENLPQNAKVQGEYLLDKFHETLDHLPYIGNVRGKGLMLIVELTADKPTKAKFDPALNIGPKLQDATRRRGVIVRCNNEGIAMSPPLILSRDEADTMFTAVVDSLEEVLA